MTTTLDGVSDNYIKRWLWANVAKFMTLRWGKENLTRLAREGRMGPGSAQRIKACETSVGIDIVAQAAKALDVAPHQLLVDPADEAGGRLLVAWHDTDETGRTMLATALEAAEHRADERRKKLGATRPPDHR